MHLIHFKFSQAINADIGFSFWEPAHSEIFKAPAFWRLNDKCKEEHGTHEKIRMNIVWMINPRLKVLPYKESEEHSESNGGVIEMPKASDVVDIVVVVVVLVVVLVVVMVGVVVVARVALLVVVVVVVVLLLLPLLLLLFELWVKRRSCRIVLCLVFDLKGFMEIRTDSSCSIWRVDCKK